MMIIGMRLIVGLFPKHKKNLNLGLEIQNMSLETIQVPYLQKDST